MTKRIAIYARYSGKRQKMTSIEDQIAMAKKFCAHQGWEVTQVFIDPAMTGRHSRRPGLQAMLKAARNHEFDAIVVELLDRLTRRMADALSAFEALQFQGIELHSVVEGQYDFYRVLIAALGAQLLSQSTGQHTRREMPGGLMRGTVNTSALGYRKAKTETGLTREIDPEEAEIVRRIFTEFAQGRSALDIARGLNADGIPAPRGGTWDSSSIRGNPKRYEGILRNRLYIGIASICKIGRKLDPETGTKKTFPTPHDAVEKEFPELRIVPQELWDAVQAELKRREGMKKDKGNAVGARRTRYLLSGLLFCGVCGKRYIKTSKTSYSCAEADKNACHNRTGISRKRIERRVFDTLRGVLQSPEFISRFDAALKAAHSEASVEHLESELSTSQRALASAEKGRDNIIKAIKEGAPYAIYKEEAQHLEGQVERLTKKVNTLLKQQSRMEGPSLDSATLYSKALSQMETLLGAADLVDEANSYLRTLIPRIVLTPNDDAEHGLDVVMETDFVALLGIHGDAMSTAETLDSVKARYRIVC